MAQFYDPSFGPHKTYLSPDESRHIVRVLRMTEGQSLEVIDGKGNRYFGTIEIASNKKVVVTIKDHEIISPRSVHFHLAFAPTKSRDRTEWLIEKAVELGVEEITPLQGDHSERIKFNSDRWEKIMVSAMKQSKRAYLPKLNALQRTADFWPQAKEKNKYLAHCQEGVKIDLTQIDVDDTVIAIGPEGDFSASEIEHGLTAGWTALSLGDMRLRTETAGLITCASVALKYMNLR